MSYAILNLVYGIPLSWSHEDLLDEENFNKYQHINTELEKKKVNGLLKYDSKKSSSYSFSFGIEIKKISSYAHHSNLTKEMTEITEEMKIEFEKLLNRLSVETKEIVKSFGEPRLCLIWSTFSNDTEKTKNDRFYNYSYQFKIKVDSKNR